MPRDNLGFRTNPGDEVKYSYDALVHAVTVIDENHRMIHDGFWYELFQEDAALANGAVIDILLQVPAGTFPHFQELDITVDNGPVRVQLFEGTTFSAAGAALSWINKNRNSSNTANTVITLAPTITDVGTQLKGKAAPTAGGIVLFNQAEGGEWILAPSTDYLVRITNNSGVTVDFNLAMALYEVGYEV